MRVADKLGLNEGNVLKSSCDVSAEEIHISLNDLLRSVPQMISLPMMVQD
jgi:hypothetical protein